jgi:hypothetical protein
MLMYPSSNCRPGDFQLIIAIWHISLWRHYRNGFSVHPDSQSLVPQKIRTSTGRKWVSVGFEAINPQLIPRLFGIGFKVVQSPRIASYTCPSCKLAEQRLQLNVDAGAIERARDRRSANYHLDLWPFPSWGNMSFYHNPTQGTLLGSFPSFSLISRPHDRRSLVMSLNRPERCLCLSSGFSQVLKTKQSSNTFSPTICLEGSFMGGHASLPKATTLYVVCCRSRNKWRAKSAKCRHLYPTFTPSPSSSWTI